MPPPVDDDWRARRGSAPLSVAADATRRPPDHDPPCNGDVTTATVMSSTRPQAAFSPSLLHRVQSLHTADSRAAIPLSPLFSEVFLSPLAPHHSLSCVAHLFFLGWPLFSSLVCFLMKFLQTEPPLKLQSPSWMHEIWSHFPYCRSISSCRQLFLR
ncbi:hypothetical protein ACQJBY_019528 [Aegilops geniculata]